MLNDEEKEAIEVLNHFNPVDCGREDTQAIETILNLIDKQSKEIEELKNITKSYDSFLGTEKIVIADKKFFVNGYFRENYISKDKIKAKIEEVEQWELYNMKIPRLSTLDERLGAKIGIKYVLQSLLEKE